MRLPLASHADLLGELESVRFLLERHDAKVVTSMDGWLNMRESLLEHERDVLAQLAETEAVRVGCEADV